MDMVIWLLAGAAMGWSGLSFLNLNEERGPVVSMVIGAVGGAVGGKAIAPMFIASAAVPSGFATSTLVVAMIVAAVALVVANMVYARFGV